MSWMLYGRVEQSFLSAPLCLCFPLLISSTSATFSFHHIILLFVIHTLNCSYMHSLHKRSAGLSSVNKRPAVALSMTMALRSACMPHTALRAAADKRSTVLRFTLQTLQRIFDIYRMLLCPLLTFKRSSLHLSRRIYWVIMLCFLSVQQSAHIFQFTQKVRSWNCIWIHDLFLLLKWRLNRLPTAIHTSKVN